MTTTPISGARDYAVRIDYLSGGEVFIVEHFRLAIAPDEDIRVVASKLATNSTYSNERVPDLVCIVAIDAVEPEGPDGAPPGAAALMPKCSNCGDTDITRDASTRWNTARQCWELSTVYDNQACMNCGASGNNLAQWIPLAQVRADFLCAVAGQFDDPALTGDPVFQRLIGDVFETMTIEEAVRQWRDANKLPE